jgi:hypothetical protein
MQKIVQNLRGRFLDINCFVIACKIFFFLGTY